MNRQIAIQTLLALIKKEALAKVTSGYASNNPQNYPLQLLNYLLQSKEENINHWFTALGVLSIHQAMFAINLLQDAHKLSGYQPFTWPKEAELLDVIAQGAKLTKADAG
ncbi:MAG: hypothetical protein JWO32_742 [Bacteroidetes bacterium]|nr:hypothetical protein [Bacteroidota bacterium]